MRPVALLLVGGAVLLIWLVLMAVAVWYFYEHWEARLTLHDQPVRLRLPEGLVALATVDAPLHTRVDLRPRVRVPVHQTVRAELHDPIEAQVQLHTVLPIDTSVTVERSVPVRTTLNLSVALRSWLPRMPVTVPITLDVPLHMTVPVKAMVPLDLDVRVKGSLPPSIDVPVDAVFELRPHVQGRIDARMVSDTAFSLVSPLSPFQVRIARADLSVPFNLTFLTQRRGTVSTQAPTPDTRASAP